MTKFLQYFANRPKFMVIFWLIVGLSVFYSAEVFIFQWLFIKSVASFPFFVNVFIGFSMVIFVLASLFSESFWTVAKKMKSQGISGKSTRAQTTLVMLLTLVCVSPASLFFLLFLWGANSGIKAPWALIIILMGIMGLLLTLIYGFTVLLKCLSEMHKINYWRASLLILLGVTFVMALIIKYGAIAQDELLWVDHFLNIKSDPFV